MDPLHRSACLSILLLAVACGGAMALPAPALPLPPCEGEQPGACPQLNDNVTGQSSGRLSANGTIAVNVDPTLPVCDEHIGFPPYIWSPGPCYSAVHAPAVLGCGYIDLEDDNRWVERSCAGALYRDPSDATFPMFTVAPGPESTGCGGRGDYQTYVYGGPGNIQNRKWVNLGPTRLGCELTFNGSRPDGLYGPTWVKLRVGIDRAEDGDERRGYAEYAEIFVPIDGDLREEAVDVSVLATSSLERQGEALIVTYTVTLTNEGEKDAEGVSLRSSYIRAGGLDDSGIDRRQRGMPLQLHLTEIPDGCTPNPPNAFVGGSFSCQNISLAAKGDPLGNDVEFFEVVARVTNATDLPSLTFEAIAPGDVDETNNENTTFLDPGLGDASIAQTRQLMTAIDPYFDYQTELLESQCNVYREDIYDRLERIRLEHPEAFQNLAFGPITSGKYITEAGSRAGHVGVVVYPKGTNYRETGIIIHGTPSVSPLGAFADSFDTQVGTFPIGEQPLETRSRGTSVHGYYYRTPAVQFPGTPRPEDDGCGFEGLYANNRDEFARAQSCNAVAKNGVSCPFDPGAVVIATESPVDLRVTNDAGQRLETLGDLLAVQEIPGGIHSMAFPHEDGTFGWTLVLPAAEYDVDLIGLADGPYRLTMTRFDRSADPVETIIEGTAEPGTTESFEFRDILFADDFEDGDG